MINSLNTSYKVLTANQLVILFTSNGGATSTISRASTLRFLTNEVINFIVSLDVNPKASGVPVPGA